MREPSFSLMGMPYNGSTLHKGGPLRPRSAIRRIFDGSICSSFPSFGLFGFIFPPRVSLLECVIYFSCALHLRPMILIIIIIIADNCKWDNRLLTRFMGIFSPFFSSFPYPVSMAEEQIFTAWTFW